MPDPNTNEVAIYPCRDSETQLWFCEIAFTETGATWFRSEFRRTRRDAIARARAELAEKVKVKGGAR